MVVYKAHKKLDNKTNVFFCKYHEKELQVGPGGGSVNIIIYIYGMHRKYMVCIKEISSCGTDTTINYWGFSYHHVPSFNDEVSKGSF
jgi:hypothetical protein